jgi:hypothetical protein
MEEKLKNLSKPVTNFLKMLNEESCDIFKVNYWNGLEAHLKKSNIPAEILTKFIFSEILSKSNDIFKSKNLLYCIFEFLKSNGNEALFLSGAFKLLNDLIQNYEENYILFRNYLCELSVNLIFDHIDQVSSLEVLPNVNAYVRSLVELDLSFLFVVLRNKIEFDGEGNVIQLLMEKARDIFMSILGKLDESQLEYFIGLLPRVSEYSHNLEMVNLFLMKTLRELIMSKATSDVNYVITISLKLLNYLLRFEITEKMVPKTEEFLLLITESIITEKKLFINILPVLYRYLLTEKFHTFSKVLVAFLLYHCEEVYDSHSIGLYKQILDYSLKGDLNLTYIVSRQCLKVFSILHGGKVFSLNNSVINKKIKVVKDKADHSADFTKIQNNRNIAHFNLINYLIQSCIKESEDCFVFYSESLKDNIKILFNLNLEHYDIGFQNYFIKFLLQFIYIAYQDSPTDIDPELCKIVLTQVTKLSNQAYIKTEIFPLVVSLLQSLVYSNLDKLVDANILDTFFDFFLYFARNEACVNLISKLLVVLFNTKIPGNYKQIALDKYTQLVLKANSGKVFASYFTFIQDSMKTLDTPELISPIYLAIYHYSTHYEGVLHSSIIDFLFAKFDSMFDNLPLCNFESLFVFSCIHEILKKDQPENIISKLIQNFHDKKILKIIDKFIKLNTPVAEESSGSYSLEKVIASKKFNDEGYLGIANMIAFSKIFSDFISNLVINNKQLFDVKNASDAANKTVTTIFDTFYFITSLIFEEKNWNLSLVLFLNEFFAKQENLNFYISTHSYFMAIENIEKNPTLDYSQLSEINVKIIHDKNNKFIKLIFFNKCSINYLRKLFINLITYEINILQLLESKNRKGAGGNKNYVINNLYDGMASSNLFNFTKSNNKLENGKQDSFFIKEFLRNVYENCEDVEATSKIFELMLHEGILNNYFKSLCDYVNTDLFFLNYYVVLRANPKEVHLRRNFLQFLICFSKLDKNVFQASLRLLLNRNIFERVLYNDGAFNAELFTLVDFILTQLIYYNSYRNETNTYIITLLTNVLTVVEKDVNSNLKYFGKIIKSLYEILTTQHYDEASHTKIEVNKKFKEVLLCTLGDDWLYVYISMVFDTENFNKDMDYNSYFENFDIVQGLKELKLLNSKDERYVLLTRDNMIFNTIMCFSEISFHRAVNTLINEILNKSDNSLYTSIVENYIIYHIVIKSNKKLFFDLAKSLYLNPEFKTVEFKYKLRFLSMLVLTLLKDASMACCFFGKNRALEAIGSILHVNIFRR